MNMGQQVRSASKSYLWEKKRGREKKKKSIRQLSQLPVFAPLLRKCAGGAQPINSQLPLRRRGSGVAVPARRETKLRDHERAVV